MSILKQGKVQIYTGEGKGKTTAALGLAWRMLGRGGRVYVCQFCKPPTCPTGEAMLAEKLQESLDNQLVFERLEQKWDLCRGEPSTEQVTAMRAALTRKLAELSVLVAAGEFDLVILDELVFCISRGLARREDVLALIAARAAHVELVLTGRGADDALIQQADLVTRMEPAKHYFDAGVSCRPGIEY